jgi:effector-binding domain-containing protein
MKKVLRFLLVLILILGVGYVILCVAGPAETTIEHSAMINAPKSVVWNQMVKFQNWGNWNPWNEDDPKMEVTVTGDDGNPGSVYHWTGPKSGAGNITNSTLSDGEMKYHMNFLKPIEAEADGFVKVADAGNGSTKATWGFHSNNKFMFRGMTLVMGDGLNKSFDRGIQKLKTYCESHVSEAAGATASFDIKEMQYPGHTYATVRKTVKMKELSSFFMDSYSALGKSAGKNISGPASGIYYTWDQEKQQTDVAAGFPVSGVTAINGATMITAPPSKGYQIVYTGTPSASMAAHDALGKHIEDKKQEQTFVIEEYIKGAKEEQDSTKWVTNIIYLVK